MNIGVNMLYPSEYRERQTDLAVVVPTYNERDNIAELINGIETSLKGTSFEILVIDDNSPDRTADEAEELKRKYSNIRVVRRPSKLGLGSAVADAFKKTGASVLAVMDADLQHPFELLPGMYEKAREGYDLVLASRYVEGGKVEDWSLVRRIVSWGAIRLAHLILPKTRGVKDAVSGYFILRREVIDGVELNPKGYKILLEILSLGKCSSVVEVPYTFNPRRKGRSKLALKEITNYIRLLIKLKRGGNLVAIKTT
jgi:dolichol-phosphate mannosyltransferase